MVLSIEERVFLVEYFFREGTRYTDLVQEQFAKNSQSHLYIIVMQFVRETDSVLDAELSGRPSKLNDNKLKKLIDISDSVLRSSSKSLRKLAQEKDIGLATALKVVREKLDLFPYKVIGFRPV
jgi:hypothetical protein